jgi:hypothetical protein
VTTVEDIISRLEKTASVIGEVWLRKNRDRAEFARLFLQP